MKIRSLIFVLVAAGGMAAAGSYDAATIRTRAAPNVAPAMEVDDDTIAARVADQLEAVLGDDAETVEIDVVDGTVTLSGTVENEPARRRVHDAIWTVAGVRGLRVDRLHASTYRY
jgi:osmotically-inducible protein OsmY